MKGKVARKLREVSQTLPVGDRIDITQKFYKELKYEFIRNKKAPR